MKKFFALVLFVYILSIVFAKNNQPPSMNGKVEIHFCNNGIGISQKITDKIFQPFFTSKPTGEGTGLRLFLAYDIVTKEHGGQIKVESKEGKGAEFIIQLPILK